MGPEPSAQDVLGRPEVAQVLEDRKARFRSPNPDEILLASSMQRSNRQTKYHSLRPPASTAGAGALEALQELFFRLGGSTWCGWQTKPKAAIRFCAWGQLQGESSYQLCTTCFGHPPSAATDSTSSSDSSSTSGPV